MTANDLQAMLPKYLPNSIMYSAYVHNYSSNTFRDFRLPNTKLVYTKQGVLEKTKKNIASLIGTFRRVCAEIMKKCDLVT